MVAKVQNKKQSKGRQHHGKGVVSEQVLDEAVAAKQAEIDDLKERLQKQGGKVRKITADSTASVKEYQERAQQAAQERDAAVKKVENLQESEKALHTELADLRESTKKELNAANQKQGQVIKELRDRIAELEARKGPIVEKLKQLREVFAAIAHSEWAGWMKYMFSVGKLTEDEDFVIEAKQHREWVRKRVLNYRDLTESERRFDQHSADKYIEAVRKFLVGE